MDLGYAKVIIKIRKTVCFVLFLAFHDKNHVPWLILSITRPAVFFIATQGRELRCLSIIPTKTLRKFCHLTNLWYLCTTTSKIKTMNLSIILIGILVFLAITVISLYNGLVRKRNMVENAFAGIDVQLKKRYDMIPMLVETAKGYMKHEQEVLTRLAQLRSTPFANMSNEQKSELDKGIVRIVEGLRVTVEKYPDLKASTNMLQLQRSINETEEQLSASRRSYNAAVMSYNNSLQTFPSNIIAGIFSFSKKDFFAANAEERENVTVSF